jgi:hypothetical protein
VGEIHFDIGFDLPQAVGVRASNNSRVGRELTENALLRECPMSLLSGILGKFPVPPNPLVLPSGLPPWLLSAVLRRAPCNHQVALVQAMPPMRSEVSVPGIRNDRGKLPVVTGAAAGRVSGPNPGTNGPGAGGGACES